MEGQAPRSRDAVFSVASLRGQLRIAGGCYADDTGPVNPVFCHFGEAFSAFVRRPADVLDQLRAIKAAGYVGIRFWDHLGYYSEAWRNKEVSPWTFESHTGLRVQATPEYYGQLEAFLSAVRDLGLVVRHSRGDLNAIPFAQVLEHCERVAAIYDRVGAFVCAVAEGANEAWQNGVDTPEKLRQMVAPFKRRGILTELSCPPGASEEPADLQAYSSGADVWVVHGARIEYPRLIGHIHALGYEIPSEFPRPRLGDQGEPSGPGPGVTVGQVNDVNVLQLMAVVSLMARQMWTYMSSFGVFWDGRIETMPGFAEVPQAAALVPKGVMGWKLIHGGTSWRGTRVYAAPTDGQTRCDQAIDPNTGNFMAVPYGPLWKECAAERAHTVTLQQDFGNKGRLILGRLS
jgi:hypothetical protein